MLQDFSFKDNPQLNRFELHTVNAMAYVEYIRDSNKIIIFNTVVPEPLTKVDNMGRYLLSCVIDSCKMSKTEIEIHCPFARAIVYIDINRN